jgi:NAD-dependent deacetylase sirtuin 2
VVQAHGGFDKAHCIDCRTEYSVASVREQLMTDQIPRCSAVLGSVASSDAPCNGLVKPDIVFFGESLPKRFFQCVANDFSSADLLIVMGTSLKVQPFASLIGQVGSNVPRLLINREAVGVRPKIPNELLERMMMLGLIDIDDLSSGFAFDEPNNQRDVFLPGDCDSGVRTMAQLMGVESELDALQSSFKL